MLKMYEIGNKLKNVKGILPYTFVNSTLQMYTSSRAEGEAIVLTANAHRTTNSHVAQRCPQSDCPRPSECAKGATTRGETKRSDRTPLRDERKRGEPPNDKHPAWMQGGRGGRR